MIPRRKRTKIGLIFMGLTLFLIGLIMAQFWKNLILKRFHSEMSLQPGSLAYRRWTSVDDPIKSSFYLWNWTNPEQITNESVKPSFTEMGPYVFWQFREKVSLKYNKENGTITYRNKLYFYFDPELSNGSLSDEVTSINAVAASAAYKTRTWNRFLLYPISMFLRSSGQQVWWTKNVSQLLFEGFENPVQKLSSYIPGLDVPDKFAYLYGFNNTARPGILNIDSGHDVNKIGKIYFVDYKNESDVYPDCKGIRGSTAELFPPFVTPDRRLDIFFPEICRPVFHYYVGESVYEGLTTYVFSPTEKTFDNGSEVPENKCYCIEEDDTPSGLFDLSRCRKEVQIGMSLPHFLLADSYYQNRIDGMEPDRAKHLYYTALEPTTGIQVNTSVRLQANVRLSRNPGLSLYRNVPDLYIPVFWQESEILLKGQYLSAIHSLLFLLKYGSHICYGLSGLGLATVLLIVLLYSQNQNFLTRIKRNPNSQRQQSAKQLEEGNSDIEFEREKKPVKCVIFNDKIVVVD